MNSKLLGRRLYGQSYWMVSKFLTFYFGDATPGVILTALLDKEEFWSEKNQIYPDGWFYVSTRKLYEYTGIKRRSQESCIDKLVKLGFIETSLGISKDKNTVRFFRINSNRLVDFFLNEPDIDLKSSSEKSDDPDEKSDDPDEKTDRGLVNSYKGDSRFVQQVKNIKVKKLSSITRGSSTLRIKILPLSSDVVEKPKIQIKQIPVIEQPVEKPLKKYSPKIQQIITAWESKGFNSHSIGTKARDTCVTYIKQLLTGKFHLSIGNKDKEYYQWSQKKFSVEEIFSAFDTFEKKLTWIDHEPINKEFLRVLSKNWSRFFWNYGTSQSEFLECFYRGIVPLKIKLKNIPDLQAEHDGGRAYILPRLISYFTKIKGTEPLESDIRNLTKVSNNLFRFYQKEVVPIPYDVYSKFRWTSSGSIYTAVVDTLEDYWNKQLQRFPVEQKSDHFQSYWMLIEKNVFDVFSSTTFKIE